MKKFWALLFVLATIASFITVNAAAANYTYDFEEDSDYYPWYVGSNGWAWIGKDATDWPIGIDTKLVDKDKPIIELSTAQKFSGDQSVLIKSTGATEGGFINFYPIQWNANGPKITPDDITVKYHIYIPSDSVLTNFQLKHIDGNWQWVNAPDDVLTTNKEGNTDKWIEIDHKIGPNDKGNVISCIFQFAVDAGAKYGDPLFYIDAVQIVDNATGKIYKADGTFFTADSSDNNDDNDDNNNGNTDDDNTPPKTFDAGIISFAVIGLTGVGGTIVAKKRR